MIVPDDLKERKNKNIIYRVLGGLAPSDPMRPPTHLVVLQIPTFDLLVFSTGEEVGAAGADCYAAHRTDVSSQREFQPPTGQVPDLSGKSI